MEASLALLLKFLDGLPDALLLLSAEGIILGANRRFAQLGIEPSALHGRPLAEVTIEAAETVVDYLERCSRSSEPLPGALTLRMPDGREVPCRADGNRLDPGWEGADADSGAIVMLRLAHGDSSLGQFVALSHRIDELDKAVERRTRAEDELREQKEWLRVALRSIGDAVIATDTAGRVSFMNPVAESLCGWPQDDAVGRPLEEVFCIINEKSRLPADNPVGHVLREGIVVGLANHTVLIARDGTETPIDDSAAPIIDEEGKVSGVILVFRDVSARRRAAETRERLAAIVESSEEIIVSKTLDGIITSWNHGAELALGYKPEEIIGRHISTIMPPESIEDTEKILGRIARGERVEHYETKRRRKDGTIIDVSLTVSPIRNDEGEIIGASKVGRDITGLKKITELRMQLAAIVESSDDIIVSKTLDGIITSWNRGAERVLGYTADEMIGRHISTLMPSESLEDTEKILGRIAHGERIEHYETKRRRKDGTTIDVSLTVSPVRDASGRIIGASKIGRDITELKRIEAERKEADRRKDEFLAMLAHELRNPLASINNAVHLFGQLETERDLEWAKEVVQRQVKHLARLIDDLLDVSRISRGKISLRREPLDLSPVVASAVEAVRPLLEERKHELSVSLVNGGLRLEADPLRLEQILINLLNNAAKYTDAGGHVSLTARREGPDVVIMIKDTGMGITPELLPHIFDLFAQGDRTMARSEGGLGIGLTLVQKLARMHGGEVTATSRGPGQGSEFVIRLPGLDHPPGPRAGAAATLPRVARERSRVLVVDDNVDSARGLARLLRLLGHDVWVAHHGETAVEVARSQRPEVVLLDIGLPGMDGYEVVRRLRTEDWAKTALIVAVSGYGQPEDLRRSREAGFDEHLVKPVDYDVLMDMLGSPRA